MKLSDQQLGELVTVWFDTPVAHLVCDLSFEKLLRYRMSKVVEALGNMATPMAEHEQVQLYQEWGEQSR